MIFFQDVRKVYSFIILVLNQKQFILWLTKVLLISIITSLSTISIYPYLSLITNPEIIHSWELPKILAWVKDTRIETTLLVTSVSIGMLVVLASVLQIYRIKITESLFAEAFANLSKKALMATLSKDYADKIQISDEEYMNSLVVETLQLCTQAIRPVLDFFASLIMITFTLGAVVYIQPTVILPIVIVVCSVYIALYTYTRRWILQWGTIKTTSNDNRMRIADVAVHGFEEVKSGNHEQEIITQFYHASRQVGNSQANIGMLLQLPQIVLLSTITVAMIGYSGIITLQNANVTLTEFIPIIGVILISMQRLLPEISKVWRTVSQISYSKPIFQQFVKLFPQLAQQEETFVKGSFPRHFETLSLKDLSVTVNGNLLLNNIFLTVNRGEKILITGASGSGKSFLLRVLAGIVTNYTGTFHVDTKNFNSDARFLRSIFSFCGQRPRLLTNSKEEELTYFRQTELIDSIYNNLMAKLNLTEPLSDIGGKRVWRSDFFSGGQLQRIALLRTLLSDREILVFDEPTSALDPVNSLIVMDLLKDEARTVICVTHATDIEPYFDRHFIMSDGKLIEQ